MKKKLSWFLAMIFAMVFTGAAEAKTYGKRICKQDGFYCKKVGKGETWESLFSNSNTRDLLKRLNRMNIQLRAGMTIAVPRSLGWLSKMDLAPFPKTNKSINRKTVIVDQSELAWGAYNANGQLLNWGPISGGKNYCADVKRGCNTVKGNFTFYRKKGEGCRSNKFPIGRGGAKMPYCMFFHRGFAMHGSYTVPGYNASHGCVRLFVDDARWLNKEFVDIGKTKVIVRP